MFKFTPGPWEVQFYNPCGCCVIPVTDPNLPPPSAIAVCYGPDSRPNADLIAAAPELLKRLTELVDVILDSEINPCKAYEAAMLIEGLRWSTR